MQGKNSLVVMQGGIGDVLLWTPALKAFERRPDVIFLYNTPVIEALKMNRLVDQIFVINTKYELFLFVMKHVDHYEYCFLNHLCGGNWLLKAMKVVARKIVTNSKHFASEKKSGRERNTSAGA